MRRKTFFLKGPCGVLFALTAFAASAEAANPADLREAKQFLARLPPACKDSYITERSDGTVVIHISCTSSSDSMEGLVEIKDGVVTGIR